MKPQDEGSSHRVWVLRRRRVRLVLEEECEEEHGAQQCDREENDRFRQCASSHVNIDPAFTILLLDRSLEVVFFYFLTKARRCPLNDQNTLDIFGSFHDVQAKDLIQCVCKANTLYTHYNSHVNYQIK